MAENKIPTFAVVDDDTKRVGAWIEAINAFNLVRLESVAPQATFEEEIGKLAGGNVDGIIMDLVLDDYASNGHFVKYTSNSIVQALRDRFSLGKNANARSQPVVLWSSEPNLKKHYVREFTAHDLYDMTIVKSEIAKDAEGIAGRLQSLATGYQQIRRQRSAGKSGFVKLTAAGKRRLPVALGSHFASSTDGAFPEHEFARYILRELVGQPYPLVDDALLASRLGVDRSGSAWPRLLLKFQSAKYEGVFSTGWPRWWWDDVVSLLTRQEIAIQSFRRLDATARIPLLAKTFKVRGLVAATPIEPSYSTAFWTVCDGLGLPLDPRNGFVSTYTSREIWHDPRYISLKSAIKGVKNSPELGVSASERSRFEAYIADVPKASRAT